MAQVHKECYVCKACGCGTALYLHNGQHYCKRHLPTNQVNAQGKRDDQVLTPEQRHKYNS